LDPRTPLGPPGGQPAFEARAELYGVRVEERRGRCFHAHPHAQQPRAVLCPCRLQRGFQRHRVLDDHASQAPGAGARPAHPARASPRRPRGGGAATKSVGPAGVRCPPVARYTPLSRTTTMSFFGRSSPTLVSTEKPISRLPSPSVTTTRSITGSSSRPTASP